MINKFISTYFIKQRTSWCEQVFFSPFLYCQKPAYNIISYDIPDYHIWHLEEFSSYSSTEVVSGFARWGMPSYFYISLKLVGQYMLNIKVEIISTKIN